MKTFKSFILEMGQLLQHYDERHPSVTTDKGKKLESFGNLHSKIGDHEVRMKQDKKGLTRQFSVVDPKTKKAQIHLDTDSFGDGKNLTVSKVSGRQGSMVKAHELYHHLITNHGVNLMAHSQSPGGFKVWQKLHKMPGVEIKQFDSETNKTTKVQNMDNIHDFHHEIKNYRIDGHHPNVSKYLIAKKSTVNEEMMSVAGIAGTGDSRLSADQREPAVNLKSNKYLKVVKRIIRNRKK